MPSAIPRGGNSDFMAGSKVRVRYLPGDLDQAIADSYFHKLLVPMVFVLAAGFTLYR